MTSHTVVAGALVVYGLCVLSSVCGTILLTLSPASFHERLLDRPLCLSPRERRGATVRGRRPQDRTLVLDSEAPLPNSDPRGPRCFTQLWTAARL